MNGASSFISGVIYSFLFLFYGWLFLKLMIYLMKDLGWF